MSYELASLGRPDAPGVLVLDRDQLRQSGRLRVVDLVVGEHVQVAHRHRWEVELFPILDLRKEGSFEPRGSSRISHNTHRGYKNANLYFHLSHFIREGQLPKKK